VPETNGRASFLQALGRLHDRFLVDVPGVTEVWLVRHGDAYGELVATAAAEAATAEEDAAAGWGAKGRIDPPLSPAGRDQAMRLGQRLAASGVSRVWSSNLARARETAELAAAPAGLGLAVDDRLREVKTRWDSDAPAREDEDSTPYIPFVEPLDEVVARMDAAVRQIAAEAGPGGRVAAVSHAAAISMYVAHVLRLDSGPLRMLPRFTSVTVVLVRDGQVVVQSVGDVGHLLRERPGA
jgi:probable phosphoglycerate mutase